MRESAHPTPASLTSLECKSRAAAVCESLTGATGLEPATSSVTGQHDASGYDRLRPGITGYSRHNVADARAGENARVPAYTVNEDAVRHAKRLIDARRYVLRSRWQDVHPARDGNALSLEYERVYGVALRHADVSAEGQSLRSGEPPCPDAVTP
jgi:hypothetical protein